jgi:competence CoiA-like predicted nuclease
LRFEQQNYLFIILTKETIENMANQVGKRYVCPVCGAEFIVTRGGDGEMHCCGKKMEIKK